MSFEDKIRSIANKASDTAQKLETEEATKNALVMPFIAALGYDVFDPDEVVPEYTADVGTKKGEKVDYAIKRGGEVIMLIEAKRAGENLGAVHASQLYRYFSVTHARIAVLTNGVKYLFYSDLEAANKMDARPFLELDLLALRDNLIAEARKLTKESFDLENMLSAANDLKSMGAIRQILAEQLEGEPHEEFVRFFFSQANPNARFTQSAREQFARLVKKAVSQFLSDKVASRLRSALEKEDEAAPTSDPGAEEAAPDSEFTRKGVETTEEELEGFRIIKAIVCEVIQPERVGYRDTKSYFGILADDNNRKPICRLHFNRSTRYMSLFDEKKAETRYKLDGLNSIYGFAGQLREAARRYVEAEAVDGK